MLENWSRFVTLMKKEVSKASTHCILNRLAHISNILPVTLKNVMYSCVKTVNYILERLLNYRLFEAFCCVLCGNACVLLFYTDVWWLFIGRVLTRLFKRKMEMEEFLREKTVFLCKLSNFLNLLQCWHTCRCFPTSK